MSKTIYIGSDHGGLRLKEALKPFIEKQGWAVRDLGTHSPESCDYPLIAKQVCAEVLGDEGSLGILICGTGIGMSMTANHVHGIRAALCTDEYMARKAREHNDANVLCLGERVIGPGLGESVVAAYLDAAFEGGRHLRRVNLIEN